MTSDDDREPVVLAGSECESLLRAAEKFVSEHLVPYMALGPFGGLRPFEAARLTWEQVNLTDGEIRLKGTQEISVVRCLAAWSQFRSNSYTSARLPW